MVPAQEKTQLPETSESRLISKLRMRWFGLGIGFFMFFWLPIEDVKLNTVVGLALLICVWFGLNYLVGWENPLNLRSFIFVGLGIGLAVGPMAVLLILVKGGLHDHGFLDFSVGQIIGLLQTAPVLGVGGLGVGFMGWHLWNLFLQRGETRANIR